MTGGDFNLVPLAADVYESACLPLVPELRARLASTLPAGTKLWGGELLNADDAAGTHVLAKCEALRSQLALAPLTRVLRAQVPAL
jgi:hypothetical protein